MCRTVYYTSPTNAFGGISMRPFMDSQNFINIIITIIMSQWMIEWMNQWMIILSTNYQRQLFLVLTDPHTGKALVIANQSRNVRSNIKRSVNSAVRAAYRSLAAFFIDLRPKWSTVNCECLLVCLFVWFSFMRVCVNLLHYYYLVTRFHFVNVPLYGHQECLWSLVSQLRNLDIANKFASLETPQSPTNPTVRVLMLSRCTTFEQNDPTKL